MCVLLQFVFLLKLCILVRAQLKCSNGFCNHEGNCTIQNFIFTCECFNSQYFQGAHCDEVVNHCTPNPCKNGECTNAVGQYICSPCPAGFGGQRCAVRATNLHTKFYVHFNHYDYYANEQRFLTTVETLGSVDFSYELFSEHMSIDGFETDFSKSPSELRWQKSDNLSGVAVSLGLHNINMLPYQSGYYHVSHGRFWKVGLITITANVYDTATASKLYYSNTFTLRLLQPENIDCLPEIEFMHGANPQEPLFLDIARYNNFEPIVRNRCSDFSVMTYRWWIYNSHETVQLHYFGTTETTLLKIPPYRLWFNYYGEVMQSYMIHLQARETLGMLHVETVARCYIYVRSKPILATIVGGEKIDISATEPYELDGSKSRDFALSPKVEQKMTFRWDCTSNDDPENNFCRPDIGKFNKLIIPKGILLLGKSYTFIFNIRSIVNLFVTHSAQQVVTVVSEKPLKVHIKCIRNCFDERFSPGQPLHLKAECISCSAEETSRAVFTWTVKDENIDNTERLIYTPSETTSLTIGLLVSNGDRTGKASLKMTKNGSPAGGVCTITPNTGVEYETDFFVECHGYVDTDQLLTYQYISEGLAMERTNDPSAHVRLPQTTSVKVIICDFLFGCTEEELPVSVTAMQVPTDLNALKMLFKADETNLEKLLLHGDTQRALILANTVVKASSSLELADYVIEQMNNFQLYTLLEVEHLSKITENLLEPLKPIDNRKASIMAKFFQKLVKGFENVIRDDEIEELLDKPYEAMTDAVVHMLAEYSVKLEQIPEVQTIKSVPVDMKDPLAEKYPDFPSFDLTVLPRIENWLTAARELHKWIHLMGVSATNIHQPTEELLRVQRDGLTMEVFSFEGRKSRQIKTQDSTVTVTMETNMISELQKQLKSDHLLVQVATMKKNPFWWYPDEQRLSTDVLYFSAFSQKDKLRNDVELKHPIEFSMKLLSVDGASAVKPSKGHLKNSTHMSMFSIKVPTNSLLIVKFKEASAKLRIMLELNSKPRGYMLRASPKIVLPHSTNSTFRTINDLPKMVTAYLAVIAADEMDNSAGASFSFITELRECISWNFKLNDPQWSTEGCRPTLNSASDDELNCRCHHLSTFAGKIYSADVSFGAYALFDRVPINWYMILFYTLLALFLLSVLRLARKSGKLYHEYLFIELTEQDVEQDFDIVLYITTGGQWNAGSSANVTLTASTNQGLRKFIIYQNPEEPQLQQNSTCILRLPLSGNDITLPMCIELAHDNNGRYPMWYCRSIEVENLTHHQKYSIKVEQWISQQPFQLTASANSEPQTWKEAFKQTLQSNYIHWFQFQPLLGPWKYDEMPLDRFERTCIWTMKLSIIICIVACYFGRTTLETYEEERERYQSLNFDPGETLLLCVICYLFGILVELGFLHFIVNNRIEN